MVLRLERGGGPGYCIVLHCIVLYVFYISYVLCFMCFMCFMCLYVFCVFRYFMGACTLYMFMYFIYLYILCILCILCIYYICLLYLCIDRLLNPCRRIDPVFRAFALSFFIPFPELDISSLPIRSSSVTRNASPTLV